MRLESITGLKQRFAAARTADAAELEQGLLRLVINHLLAIGFIAAFLLDGALDARERAMTATLILVLPLAYGLFGWMLLRPGVNHARRFTGIAVDFLCVVMVMVIGEETATIMLVFFLWIVIGNGFRFGRWYLHFAQAISLASFTLVLLLGQFWRQQPAITAAVYLTLVAIPFYVGVLVSRLRTANERLEEARGEAESANAAKTRFLAAASHDLRQPMQALSMYASVLDERMREPASRRVVRGVQLSVRTLEQLFDSLLDVAQIESGVVRPKPAEFALLPLMESVAAAELPLAAQKGLELRVVGSRALVRSDPALLERMLQNLVANAIRYTAKGCIVIGCRRLGEARVQLQVIDSGIGIAREEQVHIFDEYYQVGGASGQGLGLGLAIVKGLGDLLGHPVSVRSAPGRGSVFSIELERATSVPAPLAAAVQPPPALDGARVVLVDDDAEIRESVGLLLEGWGCRVISGASAAEVQEALRARQVRPDAMIVDYRLADASTGQQVVELLRAEYGADLPALMITGSPNAALLRREFAGIPVALKPIPPGKLRAFLSEAVRRTSPPRGD